MSVVHAQKLARITGWLFVATFVTSIPAVVLYAPLLDHNNYILGGGHDTRIAFGAFLEILLVICNIGTAVVLYPVVKRQSQTLALGYVASRVVESTLIAVGIVSVMAAVTMQQDGVSGAGNAAVILTGQQLVAIHDMTFLLGPSFCAGIGTGIILGTLMYLSGLVPRRLALIGVIGGPFAFLAATGALFNVYDQNSGAQFALTIGEIVWELSLGIYLIVKGFRKEGLDNLGLTSTEAPEISGPAPAVAPAI